MALTPNTGDTFLREVDENLRRDQMADFAKKYGKWLIAALVLFLAAVAGWIYWQNEQKKETAQDSEALARVYDEIGTGKLDAAPRQLQQLGSDGNQVVRATALLTEAAIALQRNDRTTAISRYRTLSQEEGLPEAHRDLATVRLTALEFDTLKPEQIIARLEPLAKAGNPWFGSAGEMTAMALLRQGKRTEAGRLFAAIAADTQVPDPIRSRAVQIAGTLGVDASASLPAPAQ